MPELRKNPLTGQWVSVAPERSRRPSDYLVPHAAQDDAFCPFCPGNESATPEALAVVRAPRSGWLLRAFPNRYPALRADIPWEAHGVGTYDRMSGVGAHEIIVYTPHHNPSLAAYDAASVSRWLKTAVERSRDLAGDRRLRYISHFQNHGALAGASLPHPHAQLLALPFVPDAVRTELARAQAHYDLRGRALLGDMLNEETASGERVVAATPEAVAFCPWASASPFEVWIAARNGHSHLEFEDDGRRDAVAALIADVLHRLDQALDDPPLNVTIHTAPLREGPLPSYRWHVRVATALTRPGGFERATGCAVNTTAPERAAEYLRAPTAANEPGASELGTAPGI